MRGRMGLIVLLTPLLLAGRCDDSPTGMGTPTPSPTLENLWPNADSASWDYALHERIWGDYETNLIVYPTPEEVPPAPTLDTVAALLEADTPATTLSEDDGIFSLRFDGEITTGSGVTAQNLVEVVGWPRQGIAARGDAGDALLRRLLARRPDLRARATQLGLREAAGEPTPRDLIEPLFLHGYAWERTAAYIGTYGDLDQLLAWKFLESDLAIGHEFSHQLVPELADDIWLHARILSVGRVETPAGRFRKAVTCLYYLDYGVAGVTDEDPESDAWARTLDVGTVTYAPNVGPVHSYERKFIAVGDGGLLGPGIGELEVSLTETNQER